MSNQTLKKLIDDSSYCEFMGLSASSEYGTNQGLNIDLNDTELLTVGVSLQNNSVESYELHPLTRTGGTIYVEPFGVVLPYLFFGVIAVGIIVYFFIIKRRK
ncbi:MAG: hypothetical protein ACREA8_01745 [Nitrosotalea sp.]